jgi:SAM-dependent methyltransferase
MLNSMPCRYRDFSEVWYGVRESELKIRDIYSWHSAAAVKFVNRKFWEWCAIVQALDERGALGIGKHGLGFAVGTEPLASYFCAKGCRVLATDLDAAKSDRGWLETHQHAASLNAIFVPQLIDQDKFNALVAYQSVDMRDLKGTSGEYDFIWSSCALEHLGTLQAGLEFVLESSRFLKPGGVAVHTTEFNVRSNDATIEEGVNVIYRRRDIELLRRLLAKRGFHLVSPSFDSGNHPVDLDFDAPPFMTSGKPHVKLELDGHISTSFLLIIERPLHGPSRLKNLWLTGLLAGSLGR